MRIRLLLTLLLATIIPAATQQPGPDNWSDFVGDVVADRRRNGHRLRAALTGVYLRALGVALRVAERFGANRRADWALP